MAPLPRLGENAAPPLAVVFDMDGTLVDSAAACPDAYIDAWLEHGGPRVTRDHIIARYPLGPPRFIWRDLLGETASDDDVQVAIATYHRHLARTSRQQLAVYDGIAELLDELARRGVSTAVFTGADGPSCETLLGAVGLAGRFAHRIGTDHPLAPKPAPDGLLLACERLGVDPARVAYVGDGPLDQRCALTAGAIAVAAGWGHLHDPHEPAHLRAATPADVLQLLDDT